VGVSHLEHYAGCFDCVEINSSFYRPHRRETYERWRDATPAPFAFSVKLPRTVTHECALRHCEAELRNFLHQVSGLGRKLEVLLVQLPPSLEYEPEVARSFFGTLRARTACAIACEPRHASWFTDEAESLLRRLRIGRVAADPPRGPGGGRPGGSGELAYFRLHGTPEVYYSAYGSAFLCTLAEELRAASATCPAVWCVFDNTARHASWRNACELRALLAQGYSSPRLKDNSHDRSSVERRAEGS
jgi:uncharacterized protein YecE (DUF72 family)